MVDIITGVAQVQRRGPFGRDTDIFKAFKEGVMLPP
jgi:hypothetical protein